jgi:hypothetical protein
MSDIALVKQMFSSEQKKEQGKSEEIDAGGLKADGGQALGNPTARHSPTVSPVSTAVLTCDGVPVVEDEETSGGIMFGVRAIDLMDRRVNRGPFTKGY